jgi:hypothetical protein
LEVFMALIVMSARTKERVMRSKNPIGLTMMLAALLLSLVPAATASVVPARALSACDAAQFIADVTVPDGTNVLPGLTFAKTWRLKNVGTCTWSTAYALVFASGNQLGGASPVNLPGSVGPGQSVELSVSLTAPTAAGHYIGYWQLRNASGALFGIGANANKAWWVDINVLPATTFAVAYDFASNYCAATWYSLQGGLPCPGTDGNPGGFVLKVDKPQLENGTFATESGLILAPQNAYNGDIHGAFPAFRVQHGDRFRSVVSCAYGATGCFVTFRLDYQIDSGPVNAFWSLRKKFDGTVFRTDVDLSALAGQDVKFILTVLATGPATADRAVWSNPIIARSGPLPPASCDRAQFVSDVTVPDGKTFAPGAPFTKTWRLKNVGTCTWSPSYAMVFDTGDKMGGPDLLNLPTAVSPGQTVDLSVNLTAPTAAATYRGYWKLKNAGGARFGIGTSGTQSWWVDIRVAGPSVGRSYDFGTASSPLASGYTRVTESTAFTSAGYGWIDTSGLESRDRAAVPDALRRDFVMHSSAARAFKVDLPSGAYAVTVTMGDNDFAHDNMLVKVNGSTVLGDVDTAAGAYSINTFNVTASTGSLALEFSDAGGSDPTWVVNAVSILPGPVPSAGCDRAQFVADVTVPDGSVYAPGARFDKIWRLKNVGTCTWTTSYAMVFGTGEKMLGPDSVPLPGAVEPGKTVDMLVHLTAPATAGSYRGYWKFQNASGVPFGIGADGTKSWWVDIRVAGSAVTATPTPTQVATATPTATPTASPTPIATDTTGWNTYVNGARAFTFKFPSGSTTEDLSDTGGRINLPFTAGTNLRDKRLDVSIVEGVSPCKAPGSNPMAVTENLTFNGIPFLMQTWEEGATSHRGDNTAYSTAKGNACITLNFLLWSVVPEVVQTPPPVFDRVAESAAFTTIMSTYFNQ